MAKDPYYEPQQHHFTLAEVIRNIEHVPDYANVDRQTAMRQAFEHWAENYALVRDVRDGRTTFSGEYEAVCAPYKGSGMFYPHFVPEETAKRVEGLRAVIGGEDRVLRTDSLRGIDSPPSAGGFAGLVIAGVAAIPIKMAHKTTRREFFKEIGGLALMGGALGALMGGILSATKGPEFVALETNAAYLDRKIEEAYK